MSQKIRWGVLGWARIARNEVIPAITRSTNGTLHAIASRSEAKLAEARAELNPPALHASYEALVRDPAVDAIYNPLPNHLHKAWTIEAARHGKHVLCEKPLALDAAEAREMVEACRAHGVVFMEAFMYRYSARTAKIVEILRSGVLGDIKFVQAQFRFLLNRPGDVRREPAMGGGSLYDVGCYPVNLIGLVLDTVTGSPPGTGPRPDQVRAVAVEANGIDELFSAVLRYPGGVVASLHSGFNAHGRSCAEIIGTRGVLEVPLPFFGTGDPCLLTLDGRRQEVPVPESDRYRLQVEDFAAAILENRPPLLTATESLRNMELIDRLYAAARG